MHLKKLIALPVMAAAGILAGFTGYDHFYYDDPETDLETALVSLAEDDKDTASEYLDYITLWDYAGSEDVFNALLDDMMFEILSIEQDGSRAVAKVSISNRDMQMIYQSFIKEACQYVVDKEADVDNDFDEEKLTKHIDKMALKALEEEDPGITTGTIEIDMYLNHRQWEMVLDKEDADILFGGYLTARETAVSALEDISEGSLEAFEESYGIEIDDARHELMNAGHFIVDQLWNGCLVDIVSCINAGTDTDGNEYDLAGGMKDLNSLIDKKKSFDSYINGLDKDTYKQEISEWQKMSDALDALVSEIKAEDPEPEDYDYQPDTTDFLTAMKKYVRLAYQLDDGE